MSLSSAQLRRAAEIMDMMSRLDRELFSVLGVRSNSARVAGKTRTMSRAARAKIAKAQRARWAKAKGKPAAKKRRTLSAAARAKIAAAAKARWAKAKRAGKKSL